MNELNEKLINVRNTVFKDDKEAQISLASLKIKLSEIEDIENPNHVKVILDEHSNAIYFSRAKVPYHRDHYEASTYSGHLGIYGFTKKSLNDYCKLNSSRLENIEKLELLRAIDNGHKIAMVKVESKSFGIDTQQDLDRALKIFAKLF